MARFLAKMEAHTSCPLHQSRVPKHLTRICVSSNNTEPSVLHIAAVRSNNNFILSCAPRRICASLSFSIFILLRRLLSPSQVARELHGGPFVWRSNFSLSFSIFVCEVASLSLSPYSCAPRRQLESEVQLELEAGHIRRSLIVELRAEQALKAWLHPSRTLPRLTTSTSPRRWLEGLLGTASLYNMHPSFPL
jgi:hypothetical protein